MYIPRHFELAPERAAELLAAAETAEVVAAYPEGPEATLLPVEFAPAASGLGSLQAHVTRTNPLWKRPPLGEVLAIVSGPDAYVTPEWYPGYPAGAGVPTWNYVTVHAYGELIVRDDPGWTRGVVSRLSARHAYDLSVVPEAEVDVMLRSIVGIELRLTRVLAKAKLSQNKSPELIQRVMAGLKRRGTNADAELDDAMGAIALPHATARVELVTGIREARGAAQES